MTVAIGSVPSSATSTPSTGGTSGHAAKPSRRRTSSQQSTSLNFDTGGTVPNAVIVPVGAGGQVSFISNTSTDAIVDVVGWFPTTGRFTALNPARLADTRANTPTIDGQGSGTGAVGQDETLRL